MDKQDIYQKALLLHEKYRGKIGIAPRVPVDGLDAFSYWYTPGVAQPCREIEKNPEESYKYTNRENTIGIITDGTRVLGLGDIGPEAAMPVMEGKALIFKYLGGVDAVPVCLDTKEPDEFIRTVELLQPTFGGINLEDIAQPKCFDILDILRDRMKIPVWHDDQQGTALVVLAGFINALKVAGKETQNVRVVLMGAGAANLNIANMLILYGVQAGNIIIIDSKGIITKTNRKEQQKTYRKKWEYAQITNAEGIDGDIGNAFKGADALIALSRSEPGTVRPEWIKVMGSKPIVFTCANPLPEIWPADAHAAGAYIVATGRSDFPNQANNSLGFPGLFRGVLDIRARTITDNMCLEVAKSIARYQENKEINPECILPTMDDLDLFEHEAMAVALQAREEGLHGLDLSEDQLRLKIRNNLKEGRKYFSKTR